MSHAWIRASGSLTACDVVRRLVFSGRSPADDLQSLTAGTPMTVAAFRREAEVWRQGMLLLNHESPGAIAWIPSHRGHPSPRALARCVTLPAPIAVFGVREIHRDEPGLKRGLFRVMDLTAGAADWVLAIPAPDVPLVRVAISRHGTKETPS